MNHPCNVTNIAVSSSLAAMEGQGLTHRLSDWSLLNRNLIGPSPCWDSSRTSACPKEGMMPRPSSQLSHCRGWSDLFISSRFGLVLDQERLSLGKLGYT